jgi:hypothetical protein
VPATAPTVQRAEILIDRQLRTALDTLEQQLAQPEQEQ